MFIHFMICINSVCFYAGWQDKIMGETGFCPVMVKDKEKVSVKKYLQEIFVTENFSKNDLELLSQYYLSGRLQEDHIILIVRDCNGVEPIPQGAKGYDKTYSDQILNDSVVIGHGISLEGFNENKSSKAVLAIKWSLIRRVITGNKS